METTGSWRRKAHRKCRKNFETSGAAGQAAEEPLELLDELEPALELDPALDPPDEDPEPEAEDEADAPALDSDDEVDFALEELVVAGALLDDEPRLSLR